MNVLKICKTCHGAIPVELKNCPLCRLKALGEPSIHIKLAEEKLKALLVGMEVKNLDRLFGDERSVQDFEDLGKSIKKSMDKLQRMANAARKKATIAIETLGSLIVRSEHGSVTVNDLRRLAQEGYDRALQEEETNDID